MGKKEGAREGGEGLGREQGACSACSTFFRGLREISSFVHNQNLWLSFQSAGKCGLCGVGRNPKSVITTSLTWGFTFQEDVERVAISITAIVL